MKAVETALSRLDGVKSAKVNGRQKTVYIVKVLENKTVLPDALKAAIEEAGYGYETVTIEATGTVEKSGDGYAFVARASKQKYTLTANDDLKKLVADGKTKLLITGDVTQPEEKNGKKPLPVIEVSSAKEPPKEEK